MRLFVALPVGDRHLTLKFIGEWPEARLGELRAALQACRWRAFDFTVRGMGAFPNLRHPRVVYAAVEPNPALSALAEQVERRLAALGIAAERRSFTPHVTLRRVKNAGGDPVPALAGTFHADRFALYESRSGHYTVLDWILATPDAGSAPA